jgi:hypothetical protein
MDFFTSASSLFPIVCNGEKIEVSKTFSSAVGVRSTHYPLATNREIIVQLTFHHGKLSY